MESSIPREISNVSKAMVEIELRIGKEKKTSPVVGNREVEKQ